MQSEDSSSERQVSVHEASKRLSSPSSNSSEFESENEVHDIDADFEGEAFCCSSSPYSDRLENWNSPPRSESSASCSDSDSTSSSQGQLNKRPRIELWKRPTTGQSWPAEDCIVNEPFEEGQGDNHTESDNEEESLQSQSDEPDDQFIEQSVSDTSSSSNSGVFKVLGVG